LVDAPTVHFPAAGPIASPPTTYRPRAEHSPSTDAYVDIPPLVIFKMFALALALCSVNLNTPAPNVMPPEPQAVPPVPNDLFALVYNFHAPAINLILPFYFLTLHNKSINSSSIFDRSISAALGNLE
jgi:hypothetical protein